MTYSQRMLCEAGEKGWVFAEALHVEPRDCRGEKRCGETGAGCSFEPAGVHSTGK
jgi:hypothetical protein